MPIQMTYTQARAMLASLWDADELEGLLEIAHLLKSPRNAERLSRALVRAQRKEGTPQTIDELRKEVGLEKKRHARHRTR